MISPQCGLLGRGTGPTGAKAALCWRMPLQGPCSPVSGSSWSAVDGSKGWGLGQRGYQSPFPPGI